jgi:hypothetical protein
MPGTDLAVERRNRLEKTKPWRRQKVQLGSTDGKRQTRPEPSFPVAARTRNTKLKLCSPQIWLKDNKEKRKQAQKSNIFSIRNEVYI